MGSAVAVSLRSFARQLASMGTSAFRKVTMGLLVRGLFGDPYAGDAELAGQVGVNNKTVTKYLPSALALGIPPVAGIRSLRGAPWAASRMVHVQRLLDEGCFAGWMPFAERIDGIATGRTRGSSFATLADRHAYVELAQAVATLRLLGRHAHWQEVVQELGRAGVVLVVGDDDEAAQLALQLRILDVSTFLDSK
jgi:hypothetical protein